MSESRSLRNRSSRLALFAYHSISADGPEWLSLPPETFERQLAMLARAGFETGGSDALDAAVRGERPSRPTALLTFDDGYRDNYTTALPLLREAGAKAIVFILPPLVDDGAPLLWPEVEDHVRAHPDVMRSLDWSMVEEMAEAGVEFGSHGLRHPHLPALDGDELREELIDSRRRIVERLGRCDTFAYPFGDWDERVAAAAADAGYRFAFTCPRDDQVSATPWSVPRVPVDRRDRGFRFAIKLTATGRRLWLSPTKRRLRTVSASRGAGRAPR